MLRIEPAAWHDTVATTITDGHATFVTLMGIDDDGLQVWLRLRDASGADAVLVVDAVAPIATITDLLPDAAWCEREIAEMFGVAFLGHATSPLLLDGAVPPPMARTHFLEARQTTPWPGAKEPGGAAARRRQVPPGVRP